MNDYYHAYLKSATWQAKANEAKRRAGYRCQVCNSPERLEAHHRTYERLGCELPADLTVLCAVCHSLFSERLGALVDEQELESKIVAALLLDGGAETWAALRAILEPQTDARESGL